MSSGAGTGSQGKNGSGGYVPPSPADLDVVLDQYEFIEMLGRGGMGAVYKARQKSLDRMVAIKILPPHFTTDEDDTDFHFAERFQREARAMAKLSHPNIIAVYDFGEAKDGQFYIAMEYIEGTDLQVLVRGGQLTPEHVLGWVSQICDALQYAHSRGIVHRDIKPANIMITLEGQVKVADFGLAKLSGAEEIETKLTMTNMAMGTPDYVAPEALEMGVEVDHRADLYAVGVMLYEMLTGKVPRGAWKSPSLQIPGLDPRYDALIDRAMEADRDERFQHASEISTTLYEIATTPAKPVGGRRTLLVGDAAGTGPVKPSVSTSASGSETPASKGRSSSHTPTHSAPKAKAPVKLIAGLAIGAVGVGLGLFFVFKSESDAPPKTVVFKPETVVPAESTPQATTPPAAATVPVVAQADPGPMPIPPQEKPVASVPASVSVSAPPPETQSPFSDWTLRHSAPSGTDWRPTGNEISSSKKTTLWSPGEHGDFELELEWKVGPRGNGGVFYHVAAWNELEAFEFQLADPANAGATPTGGLYGIDLPVTNRSKPVGEWNTAKLLVRGSQREHWINGEKVLSYDVDSPDFRDRLGRTTLKTPLNTAARSGRLVLQANAGEIAYRNLRLTPLNTPPAATTSVAPTPPAVTASAEPTMPADPGLAQLQAAPTDPVSRKLAELEKIFLAAYETQVAPKHTTAIAALNTNYLAKLDRDIAAASKAGKLDEALVLRDEKTQVETHGTVPAEDAANLPAALAPLRTTYRTTLATLLANRDQLAAPLHAAYDRALATYQDELTRTQKLDEATRVKAVRDHASSRRESKPEPAAPSGSTTASPPPVGQTSATLPPPPVAPPLTADKILPPLPKPSPEDIAALANWILNDLNGRVTLMEGPSRRVIEKGEPIPRGNLKVVGIYIYAFPNDEPSRKFLDLLGGLPDLESLSIARHSGVFPIASLRGLTKLKSLTLGLGKFDDSEFPHLASLTELTEVTFSSISGFTGTGLGYLGEGITELKLNPCPHLTTEGLAYLARFRKLSSLNLYNAKGFTDEALRPLAGLSELETLLVNGTLLEGSFLTFLPDNSKLKTIDLSETAKFQPQHLIHLGKLKELETVSLPPLDPSAEAMASIAALGNLKEIQFFAPFTGEPLTGVKGFRALTKIYLDACPITDAGWAAIAESMPNLKDLTYARFADAKGPVSAAAMGEHLGKLRSLESVAAMHAGMTDEWMPAIAKLKSVRRLSLQGAGLTDAGLVSLQDMEITHLIIRQTGLTDAAVPTLKRFPALRTGEFHQTKITDPVLAEFGEFLKGRAE